MFVFVNFCACVWLAYTFAFCVCVIESKMYRQAGGKVYVLLRVKCIDKQEEKYQRKKKKKEWVERLACENFTSAREECRVARCNLSVGNDRLR